MTLKKAVILGLVLEIILGCAAAAFYFKFYIYTPTYSVRAMQKAMQSGDVEELQRRVDLDGIFQGSAVKLSGLVPENDPVYGRLKDGSFGNLCKDEFLTYVKTGKWPESKDVTAESCFQDKIGFKTVSFRSLEYIYADAPPGTEVRDEGLKDKMLGMALSLIKKYAFGEESNDASRDETALETNEALPATVTVGIRVYEPNYGDTYVLRLKLRRQEDRSWRLYDIENYTEYADELIKQNDRDFVRYKEKVRMILTATQEKLDELKGRRPEIDVNWILEARNILDDADDQLDDLKMPVAGGYLHYLLDERDSLYHELLDSYYDLAAQKEQMEDARQASDTKQKEKRRPVFNAGIWQNRLDMSTAKVAEVQKKLNDNRAKLESIVGKNIDRSAVAAKTAKVLRNNDDAAVRSANYPGVPEAVGDAHSLLGGENIPVVSAYDNKKG